jgi:amino acid transporter
MSTQATSTSTSASATGGAVLGNEANLTTIDCIAQSLAVGPIFSAAAVGGAVTALSGGVGPFVIVITTIGILGLGIVFGELAKRFPGSGTVYETIANTLGRKTALLGVGAYQMGALTLVSGIPVAASFFIRSFCELHFGISPPWFLIAALVVAAIIGTNLVGIQLSVRTQLAIITLSVIPFLVLSATIIAKGGTSGNTMAVFNPSNVAEGGSVFKGLIFAILMFVGFELSASLGEEAKDPRRSIPIAMIATILIVSALYILTQYAGAIGSGGPNELPFDFAVLGEAYVGRWLSILIELALIIDTIAVGLGFAAGTARGVFTVSRDGLLPAPLGTVNQRGVPVKALGLVTAAMVLHLVLSLSFYGTDIVQDKFIPIGAFNSFLVSSAIGSTMVSLVFSLVAFGGIAYFARHRNVKAMVGGIVGLVTAAAGFASQFIDGTKPTGDAEAAPTIALGMIGLILVWAVWQIVRRSEHVERIGTRTLSTELA